MEPIRKKRKIQPHVLIALLLLLISISAAAYCYLPQYYQFTAMGEVVSVQDIGVKGSVHFVYVREGVTRNLFERLSIASTFRDAQFTPADSSTEDDLADMKEQGAERRNETIRHAVDSMAETTDASLPVNEKNAMLDHLMEETSRYYGDSIGLMLGIGLVEESLHEDFSHNGKYRIAGTGTLESDHTVGSVGAIRNKLRTAESFGIDYFFVPMDKDSFLYEGPSNEEEAIEVAQELNLRLQVIPVSSLEGAVAFLRSLP